MPGKDPFHTGAKGSDTKVRLQKAPTVHTPDPVDLTLDPPAQDPDRVPMNAASESHGRPEAGVPQLLPNRTI